jgi:hypothetical protein
MSESGTGPWLSGFLKAETTDKENMARKPTERRIAIAQREFRIGNFYLECVCAEVEVETM